MLQKRRVTVHPVDAAQFCGCDNGTVVSYLNGIDHLVRDPAATDQDEAQPLPSRLLAHTYAGARLADVTIDTQRECVVAAAVSTAGVVACRVTPLTASQANPMAAYPVRAEGASKIVFFAGCQRLAEVRLAEKLAAATDALVDAAACPMQCLRVESGSASASLALDMAAFVEDAHTLCTCTPQLGKLQTIRFDADRICCMGGGRVGRAEVTVVLSSGVAVLCGVEEAAPSALEENEEAALAEGRQATASSSSSSSVPAAALRTAAARRSFAAANAQSNVCLLHTIQLPPVASSSTPCRVSWGGASTLWVVYTDGSVVVVQCSESTSAHDATQHNGESPQQAVGESATKATTISVQHVLQTQLTTVEEQRCALFDVCTHADPRAPVLHVAFTTASSGEGGVSVLYYGAVRAGGGTELDEKGESVPTLQWRLQSMVYDEALYGVRLDRGRYHILTQGGRGSGPLNVAVLPPGAERHTSEGGAAAVKGVCLATAIMTSPEEELGGYCRHCEDLLSVLQRSTQQLTHGFDVNSHLHRLSQAQHALYALLRRQQDSLDVTDLAPSESLPHRLLQRAAQLYRQLSAHVLLMRLGRTDTTRHLKDVLQLDKAEVASQAAQAEWTSLMRDTFRSASVYQSSVVELAMWQSSTALCVETLVSRMGLTLSDRACTMAAVLSRMDTLTTEYALFILYYSYCEMGCGGDTPLYVPPHHVQQQQRQWRESFLVASGQPTELNAWAFAAYAVDHGINPAQTCGDEPGAPMTYVLGTAVHHLGMPPYAELLPPVVNGLAHVVAVDVLLDLIPTCLTLYSAARSRVPLSMSMRLLCVAVRTGSHRMIEALYEVMRGDPLLQDLAAQPLTFAALAARDVSCLRGWVEVGSAVAGTIERTLQASENAHQRDAVLMSYYILLQRYEEAQRLCTSASAAATDPTQAQRLQVVLSYLRSLLPATPEPLSGEAQLQVAFDAESVRLPVDATVHQPWKVAAQASPLLAMSSAALKEELRRATAATERGTVSKGGALVSGAVAAAAVTATAAAVVATGKQQTQPQQTPYTYSGMGSLGAPPRARAPVFHPSTLLTSVGSSTGSRATPSPSLGSTGNPTYAR